MKRVGSLLAVLSLFALFFGTAALAQRGRGGMGMGGPYGWMYNPKTVETISGEVVKVERISSPRGRSQGVHLLVKTAKETVPVHLGPAFYLDKQDVKIEPKDRVTIKGSRITFQGKPAIVAAEVRKGDKTLKLRDETGRPLWSGMGRMGRMGRMGQP